MKKSLNNAKCYIDKVGEVELLVRRKRGSNPFKKYIIALTIALIAIIIFLLWLIFTSGEII